MNVSQIHASQKISAPSKCSRGFSHGASRVPPKIKSSTASASKNSIALRLVLPKGPDKTELQWTYIGFEEDDAEMTALRLAQANLVGPAGYVSMEDGAVGNFIQRAIHGSEDECSVLEMGGFGHVSEANRTTEASVRGFWHAYRPLMGL